MQLTPNFTLEEMTVTSTGLPNVANRTERAALLALAEHVLQPLRDALGKPVYITSAFRSAAVNRAVGGVAGSQHRKGRGRHPRAGHDLDGVGAADRRAGPAVRPAH